MVVRDTGESDMAEGKFVSYLRVSTKRQGESGLGLDAQRDAVNAYLNGGSWTLIRELVEVESGKSEDNRPKLAEAMSLCRLHNATLVVAKLDRLSRDAAFLMTLQKGSIRFVAADMPEANEMVVGLMAVIAQAERKMISARTKAALAKKRDKLAALSNEEKDDLRAKGKATSLGGYRGKLTAEIRAEGTAASIETRQNRAKGRAADLAPIVADLRASGATSLRELAAGLNDRGIPTARGGAWSAVQVSRVLANIGR